MRCSMSDTANVNNAKYAGLFDCMQSNEVFATAYIESVSTHAQLLNTNTLPWEGILNTLLPAEYFRPKTKAG